MHRMELTTQAAARRPGRQRTQAFLLLGVLLTAMWVSEVVDTLLGGRLDGLGIEPRTVDGLTGVVLAPFLHGGFGHLLANTFGFVVLGAVLAVGGLARVVSVTAITTLVSGAGTWLVAPSGEVHLGASGVVFGYAAYLLSRGVFTRRIGHVLVGLGIAMVMGTTLLVGLIPTSGVSWQGHLFGAVGGVLAARMLATTAREQRR